MRIGSIVLGLAVAAALGGCDRAPSGGDPARGSLTGSTALADAASPATPRAADRWIGRWTGPEGLFLVIAAGTAPGRYALIIKGDLDSTGDAATGIATGDAIRFGRHGITETLRAADGEATGLKYLAGKKDCLVVKPGKGFCRD